MTPHEAQQKFPFTVGGKTVNLRFPMSSARVLRDHFDCPLFDLFRNEQRLNSMTEDDLLAILHAGLLHERPELTIEQLESEVEFGDIVTGADTIINALIKSFPVDNDAGNAQGRKQSKATKKTSGKQ